MSELRGPLDFYISVTAASTQLLQLQAIDIVQPALSTEIHPTSNLFKTIHPYLPLHMTLLLHRRNKQLSEINLYLVMFCKAL